MRGGQRARHEEEEEESAFMSMTDMTVSFLFVVILLLAYFASKYNDQSMVPRADYDQVVRQRDDARREVTRLRMLIDQQEAVIKELRGAIDAKQKQIDELQREIAQLKQELEKLRKVDPLETYLALSAVERRRILETLQKQLKIDFPDLQVVISEEIDALRFQGDGLFASGSSLLRPDRRTIVEALATRLAEILPCYTLGARSNWKADCNPAHAVIEALQIEGHTDSTGDFASNLTLSTERANNTFFTIRGRAPELVELLNFRRQPVLSVAGYGQMRPVRDNATKEGRDTNRRVDLRIIMYAPSKSEEIGRIREALSAGLLRGETK
ncbi:flagellar motor protein MotB [Vineibacter terrae]|uniref:Flagellar motor protein MotB n=1 Tax=Vineibacter terrae TaxID=2586908 RepID=A0A5C8PAZ9_9HYPH|nr:OmpA family protein [Vineibacter terrae]TXL70220.1 flagellar motor protein MotB [Vineibacter terrae]